MNQKFWTCSPCGRKFYHRPTALRHLIVAHDKNTQACRQCGGLADARNPRSKAGTWNVCREHAARYAHCRWCNKGIEVGWSQGAACDCRQHGVFSDEALEVTPAFPKLV